jgi:hypothetical protein
MASLVWYLTKITALFFTLPCRFLGARKAAVLVSTNLTSPLRTQLFIINISLFILHYSSLLIYQQFFLNGEKVVYPYKYLRVRTGISFAHAACF